MVLSVHSQGWCLGMDYRLSSEWRFFRSSITGRVPLPVGPANLEISRERLQMQAERFSLESHTGHWHSSSPGVGPLPCAPKNGLCSSGSFCFKMCNQGGVGVLQFSGCSVAVVVFVTQQFFDWDIAILWLLLCYLSSCGMIIHLLRLFSICSWNLLFLLNFIKCLMLAFI